MRRNRNVTQARTTGDSSKGFCKVPTTSWSWDKWLPSNSSWMKLLLYFQNLSEMALTLLKKLKHVRSYGCFHSFTVRGQFVINLTHLKSIVHSYKTHRKCSHSDASRWNTCINCLLYSVILKYFCSTMQWTWLLTLWNSRPKQWLIFQEHLNKHSFLKAT
jgi:hypothetical protein